MHLLLLGKYEVGGCYDGVLVLDGEFLFADHDRKDSRP
jgi:hypothetical protein